MLDSANKQAKPAGPPKPRPADPVAPEVRTPERVSFQLFTRPPTPGTAGPGEAGPPTGRPVGPPAPARADEPASFGVIVDDTAPPAEGQVRLSDFLASLRPLIERAGDEELAGSGRTTRDCPYIPHWFDYYAAHPAARAERAIARFAAPERTDLEGLRAALVARARLAVRAWVRSGGREVQSPEGVDVLGDDDRLGDDRAPVAVRRRPIADGGPPPPATDPAAVRARLGEGRPLGGEVRGRMERGFGRSLAGVRVHTDAAAGRLAAGYAARAFTVGDDVAFGAGQYRPGTLTGDALLAHELAHVVQQRGPGTAREADAERDADRAAVAVLQGGEARPGAAGGLRLQRCGVEGSGYDPTQTEEYHEHPPTPEVMILRHSKGLDIDADKLGETLAQMAWYTPAHYPYIRRLFDALPWSERDDVAAAMVAHTQDSDLVTIATTAEGQALLKYIVPELMGGWVTGGEKYAAVRALRALKAHEAAEAAVGAELEDMRQAVGAARAPADTPPALTPEEIKERLRIVEVRLEEFERRWGKDAGIAAAIKAVRGRLATARANVATQALELSGSVPVAQQILETCELVIDGVDQQIGDLTGIPTRGTEEANVQLLRFVREKFVEALGAALGPDAPLRFAQAGAALHQLSLSQAQLELAVLRTRPGLFKAVEPKLQAMRAFAEWVVGELHSIEAERLEVEKAERQGQDVKARRAAAEQRLKRVVLSHRVLANWEVLVQVAEALESGFSFWSRHSIGVGDIETRLEGMAELAKGGKLDELGESVKAFETDKEIRSYYEDVPAILRRSGLVVGIGIVIVATLVTWGVGSVFAAPAGAGAGAAAGGTAATVAGGTAARITAGRIAAGLGTSYIEALVFTSVSRGLSEATGLGTRGSFLEELLWNWGLFGVLRGLGAGVKAGLKARGLARLTAPVQATSAFALLEVYGIVKFRVEEGRFPTWGEFGDMTAQAVVMLAALAALHTTVARFSPLGRFQARWGKQFEAIFRDQRTLEQDAQRALDEGTLDKFEAELKQRAESLQARLKKLIDEVIADGNVEALKTQLGPMLALELYQAVLTESMGLLPEVALRSEGTPNTFSYRHGETARLQDGLTAIGPKQVRVLDAEGRPRVVEADFGGKRPNLYFVERAPEAPPETKPPTGPAEPPVPPAEQNWLRLEAAKEALERRRIPWSRVPKDLRDLETARPRAQTKPETIEETARRLAELEAWLGKQTDTPWQTGREARIQVTADTAQAHVARLPRGPLREYLENNRGAAIVFGALSETAPKTAATRMQAIWDAWTAAGQEGDFADFAESQLVESAAAELRAAGDTALADLLQADGRVQNAFGRLGYDTGRLRAVRLYYEHGYEPGSPSRLSFAEYLQRQVGSLEVADRSWAARRGGLAVPIPAGGFEPLRTRLAALTAAGTLTPTDAGIIWRWSAMIEGLVNDSAARVPGTDPAAARAAAVLDFLLEGLGKNFSESSYRAFRLRIRSLIVDDILYLRGGDTSTSPATHDGTPVRPWDQQLTRLEAWEKRVPQGDSATIGALWTAYAQARFEMGLPGGSTVASIRTIPGRNLRLPDGRMGDAALNFGRKTDPAAPAPGEWAADYKGGDDPFDIKQARNYSTNIQANGGAFVMGGNTYQGLVFVFRSATAAEAAAKSLNAEGLHANLKVGYFSTTGPIIWVR